MASSTQNQEPGTRRTASAQRSTACRQCRAAKVKCGDQRPQCRRCAKNGLACEYPDPFELNFRNETSKVVVRAEGLWRQRASIHTEGQNDTSQTKAGRRETSPFRTKSWRTFSNAHSITGFANIQYDSEDVIRQVALTTFFRDFGCTSKIRTPWLEFFQMLPEVLEKPSNKDSPVANAVLAVALAYLARDKSYSGCEVMARTEYCKGINKITAHLQRRGEVPNNKLLASVSLMGFFESVMPDLALEDPGHGKGLFTHLYGAIAMVQTIEMQTFDALALDPRVVNFIHFQTVITCIRTRVGPPLFIRTWNGRLDSPSFQNPAAPILLLMHNIACWQADMDAAMSKSSEELVQARTQILEALATMRSADARVLQWESRAPPHLAFEIRDQNSQGDTYPLSRNHPLLSLAGAPRNVYTFRSCWAAMPRVLAFVVRAILHRNIIKCCTWMAQEQWQVSECLVQSNMSRNIVIDIIEKISCSVNSLLMDPFITLTQVYEKQPQNDQYQPEIGKGMRLMGLPWPISVVIVALGDDYVLQGVGRPRARWLKDVLNYVHEQLGIRHPRLRDPSPQRHLNTQADALNHSDFRRCDAVFLLDNDSVDVPWLNGINNF